jgi:predicted RNA binding protein YcfA (HicA-like mRNA interferase family)
VDGRSTVVPAHAGETIGPGLLSRILRDCELSREQLAGLL